MLMKMPRLMKKSGRFPIYKTVPNPESRVGKFTKEGIANALLELAKATAEMNKASLAPKTSAEPSEK